MHRSRNSHSALDKDVHVPQEDELLQDAFAGLRARRGDKTSDTTSTIQTLLVLGWHELCTGLPKRAAVLIGMAGRLLSDLVMDREANPIPSSRVNGVAIAQVEKELFGNLHCVASSLKLWIFMQLNSPVSDHSSIRDVVGLPPLDESSEHMNRFRKPWLVTY